LVIKKYISIFALLNLKTLNMKRIGNKLVILDESGEYLVIGTFKLGVTGEYVEYSL